MCCTINIWVLKFGFPAHLSQNDQTLQQETSVDYGC